MLRFRGMSRGCFLWAVLAGLAAMPASAFVTFGNGQASKWGPDVIHGTGAVVTWGFVPDGTTVDPAFRIDPFGFPDDVGVVGGSNLTQLRTLIDTNHGAGAFDAAIRNAFATWSAVADIQFVQVTDPGTVMTAPGSITPEIRISAFNPLPGHSFEGTGAVGFGPPGFPNPVTAFPESGDIFFNLHGNKFGGQQTPFHIAAGSEDVTPVDFFNFGDDLEGLFLHELGHAAIGLGHPPWDGEDPDRRVMYVGDFSNPSAPFCCAAINRQLHIDDIAGAISVYGAAAVAGDYNGSGQVEQGDLDLVLSNWGVDVEVAGVPTGWIKHLPFGLIEQTELDTVLTHWGSTTAPIRMTTNLPEPAVGVALLIWGVGAGRRRGVSPQVWR